MNIKEEIRCPISRLTDKRIKRSEARRIAALFIVSWLSSFFLPVIIFSLYFSIPITPPPPPALFILVIFLHQYFPPRQCRCVYVYKQKVQAHVRPLH